MVAAAIDHVTLVLGFQWALSELFADVISIIKQTANHIQAIFSSSIILSRCQTTNNISWLGLLDQQDS